MAARHSAELTRLREEREAALAAARAEAEQQRADGDTWAASLRAAAAAREEEVQAKLQVCSPPSRMGRVLSWTIRLETMLRL